MTINRTRLEPSQVQTQGPFKTTSKSCQDQERDMTMSGAGLSHGHIKTSCPELPSVVCSWKVSGINVTLAQWHSIPSSMCCPDGQSAAGWIHRPWSGRSNSKHGTVTAFGWLVRLRSTGSHLYLQKHADIIFITSIDYVWAADRSVRQKVCVTT